MLRGRIFWGVGGALVINTVLAVTRGFGSVQASLNQILALGLGDERLKLGCCEGIDQTSLGNDE